MDVTEQQLQGFNEIARSILALQEPDQILAEVLAYGQELVGPGLILIPASIADTPAEDQLAIPLPPSDQSLCFSGSSSEYPLVFHLAQLASQALSVCKLEFQARRHEALAAVELSINRPHELNAVLDQIVKATTVLLPATGGASITLWDPDEETFIQSASTVPQQPRETTARRVRNKGGATRWIVDNGQPMIVTDTRNDPFGANRMLDEYQLRAYAGFPLLTEDGVLGVMYALDTQVREYTPDDLDFLEALTARATLAVSRVRTFEALRHSHALLAERGRALEAANKNLEDFAHIVSHDLKSPLYGIISLVQCIENDLSEQADPECTEKLAMIRQCSGRMATLIDDILNYSRLDHTEMEMEKISLAEPIAHGLSLLTRGEHKVSIPDDPPVIWGDPVRLMQLFENLIGNAFKFMDKPQGKVTLSWDEDPAAWTVRVHDDGPGIEPDFWEEIFKPFKGKVTKAEERGSGIGLAICRKIVEQHGGTIGVNSEAGRGTTFSFTLKKPPPAE